MKRERYMTVLGGYKLDMQNHGHLVQSEVNWLEIAENLLEEYREEVEA